LFPLAVFLKTNRNSPNIWAPFYGKSITYINFDKKIGWATVWAIFSQPHLVLAPQLAVVGSIPHRIEAAERRSREFQGRALQL
jgi:hypothetical protein